MSRIRRLNRVWDDILAARCRILREEMLSLGLASAGNLALFARLQNHPRARQLSVLFDHVCHVLELPSLRGNAAKETLPFAERVLQQLGALELALIGCETESRGAVLVPEFTCLYVGPDLIRFTGPSRAGWLRWRYDGRAVVLLSERDERWELYLSQPRRQFHLPCFDDCPFTANGPRRADVEIPTWLDEKLHRETAELLRGVRAGEQERVGLIHESRMTTLADFLPAVVDAAANLLRSTYRYLQPGTYSEPVQLAPEVRSAAVLALRRGASLSGILKGFRLPEPIRRDTLLLLSLPLIS